MQSKKKNKFNDHNAESSLFFRRMLIAFCGILILTCVLVATIYNLQIIRYADYTTRSNDNRIKIIPIAPERGKIFDRNGTPLAINQTVYKLEIIPDKIDDLEKLFADLRSVVDLTDEDIVAFAKERKSTRRYNAVTLKSKLTEQQIARFVIDQHLFPFVKIRGYQHRNYPYGALLAHVLGYVAKINDNDIKRLTEADRLNDYTATKSIGKLGIERFYEETLHGKPGYEEVEVDSRGHVVRQLSQKDPTVGKDIYLTINLDLQQYITELLGSRKGAIVVMDPNNGEILALVSSPSYDPNPFVDGISVAAYKALLDDPAKPLFNRAIQGTYPPASTIKGFMAVSALAEGVITPDTTIFDVGWWQIPKTEKRYRDWKRSGHGRVTLPYSIEGSVDTFYYQVAYNMGIDRLYEWMTKFGFGQYTGIDFSRAEERRGIFPDRKWKLARYKIPWLQGDTIPVGIGQGYWNATAVQLVKSLSTLINNGEVKTPHLMMKVIGNSDEVTPYTPPYEAPIAGVNPQYWAIAKDGMYGVLYRPRGTANKVFAGTPYRAAGKSGTAQVYSLKKDEIYNEKNIPEHLHDHALFIAYAPYKDPQVAISVIWENGGGGSRNAGLVARRILDYILLGERNFSLPSKNIRFGRQD